MSRVYTDTIEPRKLTQDITLGTSGETISVGANSINVNTVADKGGNTLWTSDGSGNLSSVNAGLKGNLILISTGTATDQANFQITTGIDSTYALYIVKMIDIYAHTDGAELEWNVSIDGGSSYGVAKTTTWIYAQHNEADTSATFGYDSNRVLHNSVNEQWLMENKENDADSSGSGELWMFNFSGTTYVKHFLATTQGMQVGPGSYQAHISGFVNTTSAINALYWRMNAGNITGTFKLYGLS